MRKYEIFYAESEYGFRELSLREFTGMRWLEIGLTRYGDKLSRGAHRYLPFGRCAVFPGIISPYDGHVGAGPSDWVRFRRLGSRHEQP